MTDLLDGKAAVVTGAASGIGRGIATRYAEAGADVVVADIREEPRGGGTPTHERIESETDARATRVDCDVSEVADIESAVEAAEEFGGIDVMVNNAGYSRDEDFLEVEESAYEDMLSVNVKGTFFGAQRAARRMVGNGGGSVINVSSAEGLQGVGGHPTYGTSKGAVRLLTYALADELTADGVRVNAIHPGLIETKMTTEDTPIIGTDQEEEFRGKIADDRVGQPEDIGDAAVFLASDLADYVTGESLVVDGGMTSTL
jgi:NAD(P)-dependent dehydrogenase (short-subunit alcohol dehydrogenase family)